MIPSAAIAGRATDDTWVEAVGSRAELEPFVPAWQGLARNAIEPNTFYEPWQLLPAIDAFGGGKSAIYLLVFQRNRQLEDDLIGFFPLERVASFRGWRARILAAWQHPYALLSTPLLHRDFARDAWRAVCRWVASDERGASILEFPLLLAEGPSHEALIDVCHAEGLLSYEAEHFTRAAMHVSKDGGDAYLESAISGGRRKELRRQRRRLGDLGRVAIRALDADSDVDGWIENFLALEASGWKARERTAFLSDERAATYFRTICRKAHELGRLHMLALDLDGRPMAMKCNFTSGDGCFSLKIAHDETYRQYSPGVLLELENVIDVHRRTSLRWMDSCALPRHPMIDGLWSERRLIRHLLLGPGRTTGNLTLALFPVLRCLKRTFLDPVRTESRMQLANPTPPVPNAANCGTAAANQCLDIDPSSFAANFDRKPFLIGHKLQDHPLFELPRLMELARALPEESVEYNAGNLPISADPAQTPRTGLSIEDTIERIEQCNSWMALKYVDQDPDYRSLLTSCLDDVRHQSERLGRGMTRPEAFIFLSSPGAITPYHMDPEHNFLLQIHGSKLMTVFDRALVSPVELEHFYSGAHRNMSFKEEYLTKSQTFELTPGRGLHVPVAAPHYVRNGDGVSVSFSVTFRTPDLEDKALTHTFNSLMRRRGLRPRPVGEIPALDAAKALSCRIVRKSRSMLGRHA